MPALVRVYDKDRKAKITVSERFAQSRNLKPLDEAAERDGRALAPEFDKSSAKKADSGS